MRSLAQRAVVGWALGRQRSFGFAFRGVRRLYAEANARVHAAATVLVVALGVATRLSGTEWALVALAITAVWVAEALNTALEALADAAVPEQNPLIATAKDVAASAVLLAAAGAVAVGAAVFVPHWAPGLFDSR